MRTPAISLFIPFFDEVEALPRAVREGLAALAPFARAGCELLLVDDGSTDGSETLAQRYEQEHEAVRVVRHPRNLGFGQAMLTGLAACRGDVIAYTDADLPADPRAFAAAYPLLDGAELVIGYPRQPSEKRFRRVYTAVYNGMIRGLYGVRVRNINFPFKLLRRELLGRIRLDAASGFVDAQLVIEAKRAGARIEQFAVDYQPRRAGRSHFDHPFTALPTAADALRFRVGRR